MRVIGKMNITKKGALILLSTLAINIAQPLAVYADSNTYTSEKITSSTIEKITESDDVNVLDSKIGEETTTSNGDLNVSLPKSTTEDITLNSNDENISVGLPEENYSNAVDTGKSIIYKGTDSSLGLQTTEEGFRALISITNSQASHNYSFDLDLPDGYQIIDSSSFYDQSEGTGDIFIVNNEGIVVNMIEAPWAKDTKGNSVPTHYEINGHTLTQVIDFDEDNFYPVIADPNWVRLGRNWYNSRDNIAKAIDVALIATGYGAGVKGYSSAMKLIRANRNHISRVVESQLRSILGPSVASSALASLDVALTVGGTSAGDLIAKGLDIIDGRYDGYIFA